jgi:hypothetical protein
MTMTGRNDSITAGSPKKQAWQKPEVREMGYLKDFVRSGHAFGKSGPSIDGSSSGNDEKKE